LQELKKELKDLKQESFALEILREQRKQNKRLFVALMVALVMWFATTCAFVYYINTTGYEETIEIADTNDGENACVGDNCNNGAINGNSN
jgi:hypothetical protein